MARASENSNRPQSQQDRAVRRVPIIVADDWNDYRLIDSGNGRKLEQYGPYRMIRPDSQALWPPRLDHAQWKADAEFSGSDEGDSGRWQFHRKVPETWPMAWDGMKFHARCTPFRHLGVFPEHSVHWRWAGEQIAASLQIAPDHQPRVLNLFGYTGLASLACARAGAHVTHVDASKKAIGFARDNQALAGLADRPIRWLVEDAFRFVQREQRRGARYDGIILDPPKHGRGPNGEIWKLEEGLQDLLDSCASLLEGPSPFLVTTVYAVRLSLLALENCMSAALRGQGGVLEAGEMAIPEGEGARLLPTAIHARWTGAR
jgi:23S rRNA (cytosine1962-C5)-methyltransferase